LADADIRVDQKIKLKLVIPY